MANSLEERLQQHSNTFDGLLSLIPAKYYYDEESNNQWIEKQNKKSKEERKMNKKSKLNPNDSKNVSVKEIMEETEKHAEPVVLPGEKWKQRQQKIELEKQNEANNDNNNDEDGNEEQLFQLNTLIFDDNGDEINEGSEKEAVNVQEERKKVQKSMTTTSKRELSKEEKEAREKKQKELKAKLQEKIQRLREKRKAPGSKTPGAATSRQQILEERRRKETLRKEQRKKLQEQEQEKEESSDESDSEGEEGEEEEISASKVIFSNIEFNDGERVSSDLKSTRKIGKKKGPANNDIKAHLKKIEIERAKLQSLDKETKQELEEKSKWQRALAGVQGQKLKDDEKLLKKALKRKEAQKRKSEREWRERKQTVADGIKMRAERRDENLRIRKENKGRGKKNQIKHLPSYKRGRGSKNVTKRAGFEGGYKKRKQK